ncbi:MAG TPA: hypothetical protein VFZ79_15830 [Acidimicrobiales bacterium]
MCKIESTTATASPHSTPTTTTPNVVTAAMTTSAVPAARNARHSSRSTSPTAATTITAPRTALGRSSTGSVNNTKTTATVAAEMTPTSCVRPPVWSLTAVLDPLAPIANDWVGPAAALAAPSAKISWLARTFWPCLPAKERAVNTPSA